MKKKTGEYTRKGEFYLDRVQKVSMRYISYEPKARDVVYWKEERCVLL